MVESLADIEALALRCHSDQSKGYIAEATLCYRAGAYRAAIVSAWIAVVFDLIDKIRELALSGDQAAKQLEAQYEAYIEQIEQGNQQGFTKALEFERNILTTCRNRLQFFDQQQMKDLMRLMEDRHRCAHPSFQKLGIPYKPPAEQARLHIRNAIVYVLAQRPVQGKAALAEIKTMVSSDYFPVDIDKAIVQLRKSGLENSTDALVRSTVDQLIFGFLTQDDVLFEKKQVIVALNAIYQLFPALSEERFKKQFNKVVHDAQDDRLIWVVYLVAKVDNAWNLLDQASKQKMERFVEAAPLPNILPLCQDRCRCAMKAKPR